MRRLEPVRNALMVVWGRDVGPRETVVMHG